VNIITAQGIHLLHLLHIESGTPVTPRIPHTIQAKRTVLKKNCCNNIILDKFHDWNTVSAFHSWTTQTIPRCLFVWGHAA